MLWEIRKHRALPLKLGWCGDHWQRPRGRGSYVWPDQQVSEEELGEIAGDFLEGPTLNGAYVVII